jgi:hypothetical protein
MSYMKINKISKTCTNQKILSVGEILSHLKVPSTCPTRAPFQHGVLLKSESTGIFRDDEMH